MSFRNAVELGSGRIEADVAIVGAGAAGIALALELAHTPVRVALIESGDFRHRHRTQFLYRGKNIGRPTVSTTFSRFRRFGGSTTRWGGQCRPLDPIDFEPRADFPLSGWPLGYAELEPHYRRAQEICRLGAYDYDPQSWHSHCGGALPLDSPLLETRIYQFAWPTDLGGAWRNELDRAENVTVYLNANLVDVVTRDGADRVSALRLATLHRQAIELRAQHYVLACGGIENARLLLASRAARSNGLGNEYDLVGRFLMDHPYFFAGVYSPASPRFDRSFYVIEGYEQAGRKQKMHAAFGLSERLLREEGLNGASVYLVRRPRYKTLPAYGSKGGWGLNHLVEVLRHRELPDGRLGRSIGQVVRDFGNVCRVAASGVRHALDAERVLALRVVLETTPCRDSRVVLGPERDGFGMPRVRVDWRINDDDRRGYLRLLEVMTEEFSRLGLGRVALTACYDGDGWPVAMAGGRHHMGTTRMAKDAPEGVVDEHCRVHGIDNLHVAGSSVFPTSGYANPTLTITALAVRLAARLRTTLARSSA